MYGELIARLRSGDGSALNGALLEAADAIEALVKGQVATGSWDEQYVDDEYDKYGFFRHRFYCTNCGKYQTYGKTEYCPKCGARMWG